MLLGPIIAPGVQDIINNASTQSTKSKYGYFSNGYQPNYVTINYDNGKSSGIKKSFITGTGLKVKDTALKGSTNFAGSSIDDQTIWQSSDPNDKYYYVWVGNNGKKDANGSYGKYVAILKSDINNKKSTVTIDNGYTVNKVDLSNVKKETTTTTKKGVTTPSYTAPKAPSNNKEVQTLKDEITKYREEIKELTRVWSADEAAAYLGITNDKQKWLDEMNDRTNDYYDAAVAEQQALRNDYVRNNANYIDMLTDAYIDSTKYVAPTATNRGIQAANLMNTSMSADTTNSSNDYGMHQNVQNFEAKRKAELENNPYLAEQEYNNIQTMLSNWSANKNTSDIKQYIDRLDAYTNYYAADRAYQAYLSQANAAKYSGLANVSQNKAQAIANAYGSNVNKYANMYELFKAGYGSDYAASNQLTHLWDQSSKANQK